MKRLLLSILLTVSICGPAHAVIDGTCDFTQGTNSTQQLANGCAEEIGAILTTLTGLPGLYAPLSHTHVAANITDFASAVASSLDPTLTALSGLNTTGGFVIQTGTDTFIKRVLQASAIIGVVNPDGVAGNPVPYYVFNWSPSASPGFALGQSAFAIDTVSGTNGIIHEGPVADSFETLFQFREIVGADAYVTLIDDGSPEFLAKADRDGDDLTDATVNGVTLTTGGPSTEYLSADGSYSEPAGGGGDWVYVELAADVTIDTAFQVVLDFEPPANSAIEIEAKLIFGTEVNGDAARLRVAWPGGLIRSAGVGQVAASNTGLAFVATSHIAGSTFSQNSTTPAATFSSFLAMFDGLMVTDGSPTGVFSLGIQAEASGTDITAYAGSYLRYRVRPAP